MTPTRKTMLLFLMARESSRAIVKANHTGSYPVDIADMLAPRAKRRRQWSPQSAARWVGFIAKPLLDAGLVERRRVRTVNVYFITGAGRLEATRCAGCGATDGCGGKVHAHGCKAVAS